MLKNTVLWDVALPFLVGLLFVSEDGGSIFLRNVGLLFNDMTLHLIAVRTSKAFPKLFFRDCISTV
jgi:hypothetical protein